MRTENRKGHIMGVPYSCRFLTVADSLQLQIPYSCRFLTVADNELQSRWEEVHGVDGLCSAYFDGQYSRYDGSAFSQRVRRLSGGGSERQRYSWLCMDAGRA